MIADRRDPLLFVNNSGEEVPPGAALQPDGTVTDGKVGIVKPTRTGVAVYFNDRVPVPAGETGQCQSPYPWAVADIHLDDLPMAAGGRLGVVPGDWFLRRSGSG